MSEQSPLGQATNGNGNRFRVSWQTVVGWIVTAMLAYAAVEARVRVLEFQYATLAESLREIKASIESIPEIRADVKAILRDRGIK